MSRKKEERFNAIKKMENVFELNLNNFKKIPLSEYFKRNRNPVVLEIGCGKGDYVINMARKNPNRNFIGVDIKGDRIYIGARKALDEGLSNVLFLRTFVQFLKDQLEESSISEIWITFPDPYPSDTKSRKRLTSPFFLDIYRFLLNDEGIIHLKTDDIDFYRFTMNNLNEYGIIDFATENLYNQQELSNKLSIKTTYEKRHIANGKSIKYIRFRLN